MHKLKQISSIIFRYQVKYYLVLVSCLLSLAACKRNPTTWADDLVAPLATGSLTLGNLFPDTVIKTNPADSSLMIAFTTNLINYQIDSLLKIPDTTIVSKDTINFTYPITTSGEFNLFTSPPANNSYSFPNGIQLTKAIVKRGKVKIQLYNSYRQPLLYEYQLASATKGGVMLDTIFKIPGGSFTNPGTTICYMNLAGYTIDFTGLTHNTTNTIAQGGTLSTAPNAQADTMFSNEGLRAYFTFQGIIPQYALGYFGSQTITVGPDTTSFNVFNSIKKGILNLNSASVNLTVSNQFGVAMKADISNISSINTNNPSVVTLTHTAVPLNNLQINQAYDNNGPTNPVVSVSPAVKSITLNNSNSNVAAFIGNLPGRLSYKLTAQINPPIGGGGGNISLNNDFGYYGTTFSANLTMNVPLYFSASNLMLADTVSMDLSGVNQLQNINKGNLILTATNSYPFSINLVATLLDANKQSLGSLLSSPSLIQVPALDAATGKVIAPLKSKLYIPLTPQKISALQKAKYVTYTATFNTANQPNTQVKFYSNYTLDLLLTADVNYTVGK